MKEQPRRIAVLVADTLQSVGLQTLLSDYFAPVEIESFASYGEMAAGTPESFDYYVMPAVTYALHADFFLPRRQRVILLAQQCDDRPGANVISVSCPQEEILGRLTQIFAQADRADMPATPGRELSAREVEVLRLIVRGRINKEIADELSIGFQTVLTHRKNITAKLGIKTVSGLTFFALMNGYVSADEIRQ